MTRHTALLTRRTRALTARVRRGATSTRARTALGRCRRRARMPLTPPRTPPSRPSKKLSCSLDCPLNKLYVIAPHVTYSQDRGEPRRRLEEGQGRPWTLLRTLPRRPSAPSVQPQHQHLLCQIYGPQRLNTCMTALPPRAFGIFIMLFSIECMTPSALATPFRRL